MFITIPIFLLERQEKGGRHDGHEQVGCGQDVRRHRERNWGVREEDLQSNKSYKYSGRGPPPDLGHQKHLKRFSHTIICCPKYLSHHLVKCNSSTTRLSILIGGLCQICRFPPTRLLVAGTRGSLRWLYATHASIRGGNANKLLYSSTSS